MKIMPPQDSPEQSYPLPKFEQDILKRWIAEGAKWPEGSLSRLLNGSQDTYICRSYTTHPRIQLCRCHREGNAKGKLRLDNKADSFKSRR